MYVYGGAKNKNRTRKRREEERGQPTMTMTTTETKTTMATSNTTEIRNARGVKRAMRPHLRGTLTVLTVDGDCGRQGREFLLAARAGDSPLNKND